MTILGLPPRTKFDALRESFQKLSALDPVDKTMIDGEGEAYAQSGRDDSRAGNNPLMLPADSQNAGLAGIDDRFESVSAGPADVGEREGNWRVVCLGKPARTSALHGGVTRLSDFFERLAAKVS